ncbi:MAG: methylated-DNA--[protein]-cysteine S-methyltransferase [Beijerinckiaceae bacterium]
MAHFSLFPTALGDCGIAWSGDVIVATHLPEHSPAETSRRIAVKAGASSGEPPPAVLCAMAAITALLEGEKTDLNAIMCDFSRIDPFAVRVYEATRAIPPGQTLTYGAIAQQLGNKQLAQSVGQALGRNPFPIIVPCHRVMGANDRLIGFSANGGVETKLRLLAIEGALTGEAPGLFGDLPLAVKPRK